MSSKPPLPNQEERDAITAEIHSAFADVRRDYCRSWKELAVIDDYGDEEELRNARRAEKDTHWSQLIDDPEWEPFPGIGGFSFTDEEGFRYYLPPTMIRFLRGDTSEWFTGHLVGEIDRFTDESNTGWTTAQLQSIARFVQFMVQNDPDEEGRESWERSFCFKWRRYLPDA